MEAETENNQSKGLKSLRRFIKNIDLFGITFNFRADDRQKFSSVCSGVVFLFYCFFILAYILKSFSDYIGFNDYRIQYMQKYNDNSNLEITNKNFFYSFRFTYQEGYSYDDMVNINKGKAGNQTYIGTFGEENYVLGSIYESLFVIENKFVQKIILPSNATKKTLIRKYKCEKSKLNSSEFYELLVQEKFNPLKNDYEESFMVENQYCFNYSDYKLYGKYSDNALSYFEITLKLNETFYQQNPEKVKSIMAGVIFKFSLFYSDHIYDVSNMDDPIQKRVESTIYTYVDMLYYERVDVFFNELVYYTDKNLLVKQPSQEKKLKFSKYDKSISPMGFRFDPKATLSDKFNLVKYFIRPELTQTVISVSYMKIPEFLSGVSAMAMNIFAGLNVICGFFNRLNATQKVISKTMKFGDVFKQTHKKQIDYFVGVAKALRNNNYNNDLRIDNNNKCDNSNSYNSFDRNENFSNILKNNYKINNNKNNNYSSFSKNSNNICNIKDAIPLTEIKHNESNEIKKSKNDFVSMKNLNFEDSTRSNANFILNSNYNNNSPLSSPDSNERSNMNIINSKNKIKLDVNSDTNNNNKFNNTKVNLSLDEKNQNKNTKMDFKEINLTKNKNINNNNNHVTIFSNDKSDCFKTDIKKFKTMEITNFDFIASYFCCKNLKQKKVLFNLGRLKFDENLNFVNYSRKMMEFDIIKYLILDKSLLEMMNFIAKPNVSEEAEYAFKDGEYNNFFNPEHTKENENNFSMKRIKEAYEGLINCSSDGSEFNSFVKQRMIKLFHFQIQELK